MKLWHLYAIAALLGVVAFWITADTSDRAFERRSRERFDSSIFGRSR